MRHKLIKIPIWDRDCILVVGGDWRNILLIAKKYRLSKQTQDDIIKDAIRHDDRGAGYWCFDKGTGIVWFSRPRVDTLTLAHEVTHIVDFLLMFIGAEKEMEARAYTTEFLMSEIRKNLK